jgi:hypothetical protein
MLPANNSNEIPIRDQEQFMTIARIVGLAAAMLAFVPLLQVAAQDSNIDSDIEILRANIRADKMQLVTDEMQLSDDEAKTFWPIYRQYDSDLTKLNDEKVNLLKEYANSYEKLTSQQVQSLAHRSFELQKARVDLRQQYFTKIAHAVSPQTAGRFVQVEDRIDLLLNLQLAASVPMVQK